MQCFSPIQLKSAEYQVVPCGRCAACLANRRSEWSTRLEFELKRSVSAHFVTLTYMDPPLGGFDIPSLYKKDVQDFMKRLRKLCPEKLKYYVVGEYGSNTERPHYHAIIFNLPDKPLEILLKSWQNGIVHVGNVNAASIRYTLKYILLSKHNYERYHYVEKPFALISKGLGSNYIDSRKSWHRCDLSRNYVVKEDGKKARLPRYFRDRIYSKIDKQKQKLMYENKQREEFDVSRESREYFKSEIEGKSDFTRKVEKTIKQNDKL